ncbi:MAG: YigZ family protein [Haloarculaceae archaeon]
MVDESNRTGNSDPGPGSDADSTTGPEPFRTLAGRGRAEFVVKGSEFLGHAAPVESVEGAEAFVTEVSEAHPDATHNVPAYRVRADPFREYASDDDEPSGSAGKPVLNVLSGQDLENAAVVVTRYYGGTNLGIGGLVRAYGRAAKEAIADAGTREAVPHETVRVVVDYDDSGTVRGIVESVATAFEATYEERVAFEARVPTAEAETFRDRLRSATSGRVELG